MPAAQQAFNQAVAHGAGSSRAFAGLGVIANEQGQVDDAIAHWRRAVELDSRNFDALFNLTMALIRAGRLDEARPFATRFVNTAPGAFYAPDIHRLQAWLQR
jgi:Tfp pilus assembly protein PilF